MIMYLNVCWWQRSLAWIQAISRLSPPDRSPPYASSQPSFQLPGLTRRYFHHQSRSTLTVSGISKGKATFSKYYTVKSVSLFTTAGGWKIKLDYAIVFSRAKTTFQMGSFCSNNSITVLCQNLAIAHFIILTISCHFCFFYLRSLIFI